MSWPGPEIEQFEALDVDPATFDHQAHIYVAWRYLQQMELLECIDRYRSVLRRLTEKLGVPDKYHETITWFYMIGVSERATGAAASEWELFRNSNPDLFAKGPTIIQRFYSEARLRSDKARQTFLLPDLAPGAIPVSAE